MHVQDTGWSQEYFLKIEGTYIINSEHRDGLYEMSDDAYEDNFTRSKGSV
jgi:hypothetical protein